MLSFLKKSRKSKKRQEDKENMADVTLTGEASNTKPVKNTENESLNALYDSSQTQCSSPRLSIPLGVKGNNGVFCHGSEQKDVSRMPSSSYVKDDYDSPSVSGVSSIHSSAFNSELSPTQQTNTFNSSSTCCRNEVNKVVLTSGYSSCDEGYRTKPVKKYSASRCNTGPTPMAMSYIGSEHFLIREKKVEPPQLQHFHRPADFSYQKKRCYKLPYKQGMKELLTASNIHSKRGPVDLNTDEPIKLSRYAGGYIPDPQLPKKIETLDWPAPLFPAAVPELRERYYTRAHKCRHAKICGHENIGDSTENSYYDEARLNKDIHAVAQLNSSMAKAVLEDLKVKKKLAVQLPPIDPWRASRSPSGAVEPHQHTRYESPLFASPSRISHPLRDESLDSIRTMSHSSEPRSFAETSARSHNISDILPANTSGQENTDPECSLCSYKSSDTYGIHYWVLKTYPYKLLRTDKNKSPPSGVLHENLERHLSEKEFLTVFGMKRSRFYSLPEWKRLLLKKQAKLF